MLRGGGNRRKPNRKKRTVTRPNDVHEKPNGVVVAKVAFSFSGIEPSEHLRTEGKTIRRIDEITKTITPIRSEPDNQLTDTRLSFETSRPVQLYLHSKTAEIACSGFNPTIGGHGDRVAYWSIKHIRLKKMSTRLS